MFARDDDLLPIKLLKAVECSYGILVVVGNSYFHVCSSGRVVLMCHYSSPKSWMSGSTSFASNSSECSTCARFMRLLGMTRSTAPMPRSCRSFICATSVRGLPQNWARLSRTGAAELSLCSPVLACAGIGLDQRLGCAGDGRRAASRCAAEALFDPASLPTEI